MLQIRVTNADGSNPIILDKADDKELNLALGSADEGVTFSLPKTDPKAIYINPDLPENYQRLWEMWDTETGKRLHHGPISSIQDSSGKYTVQGKGLSQFLMDMKKTTRTFYTSIGEVIDSLRYDNLAAQPKTSTIVSSPTHLNSEVFGDITVNEKYYALSKFSKDYTIDDFDGVSYSTGDVEPSNKPYTTDQFWAGMSKNDSIIIDLGEVAPINKLELSFPWWGGITKKYDRSFKFEVAYAQEGTTNVQGRPFGEFTTILSSETPYITEPGKPLNIYTGDVENTFNTLPIFAVSGLANIEARYLRILITDVSAWYMGNYKGDYNAGTSYSLGDVVRWGNHIDIMDALPSGTLWVNSIVHSLWENTGEEFVPTWVTVPYTILDHTPLVPSGGDYYPSGTIALKTGDPLQPHLYRNDGNVHVPYWDELPIVAMDHIPTNSGIAGQNAKYILHPPSGFAEASYNITAYSEGVYTKFSDSIPVTSTPSEIQDLLDAGIPLVPPEYTLSGVLHVGGTSFGAGDITFEFVGELKERALASFASFAMRYKNPAVDVPYWQPNQVYYEGSSIQPSNQPELYYSNKFIAYQAGITGSTEPTWNTSDYYASTGDNTITWQYYGSNAVSYELPLITSGYKYTPPSSGYTFGTLWSDRDSYNVYVNSGTVTIPNWKLVTPDIILDRVPQNGTGDYAPDSGYRVVSTDNTVWTYTDVYPYQNWAMSDSTTGDHNPRNENVAVIPSVGYYISLHNNNQGSL